MSRIHKPKLTYAINKEGKLVHVNTVPNGNKCGCLCPNCKSELCAKNSGEIMEHHFAHIHGDECEGAVETALHIMAKEVLQETKQLLHPKIRIAHEPKIVNYEKVDVEYFDKETNLRPDCVGFYNNRQIWIEFKVSHKLDYNKIRKIIESKIDCIEIDLNGCKLDYNSVKEWITNKEEKIKWICNKNLNYAIKLKENPEINKDKEDSNSISLKYINEAKENLCRKFVKQEKFEIELQQNGSKKLYDLKSKKYGYKYCWKDAMLSNIAEKCDIIISRQENYNEDPDIIIINISHGNYRKKIETDFRLINLNINSSVEVSLLIYNPLEESNSCEFKGFKRV